MASATTKNAEAVAERETTEYLPRMNRNLEQKSINILHEINDLRVFVGLDQLPRFGVQTVTSPIMLFSLRLPVFGL